MQKTLQHEMEQNLPFEGLMAELSARFINLPAKELDGAIETAQHLVCENLQLDRSALFQRCDERPEQLLLTHLYHREGAGGPAAKRPAEFGSGSRAICLEGTELPQRYTQINVSVLFPWFYQQLQRRQTVAIAELEALPPEAACDRDRLLRYGTKSIVVVPLFTGGQWLGCLSFATMRQHRQWSPPTIKRLEFVADVFTNALARNRADGALEETQARLTLATESAGTALWSMDAASGRVWLTSNTRDLLHLGPEDELTEKSFSQLLHPDDRDRFSGAIQLAIRTGQVLSVDFRILLPDGRLKWISARGRRQDATGATGLRLMGACVDITEHKQAEEKLRDSEERFRALVEQAGDGFELLSTTGSYLDVNAATLKQLGYTREEMLRLTKFDVDKAMSHDKFLQLEQLLQKSSPFRMESVHCRKDGSTFPVEITISSVQFGSCRCFLSLVRDITERRQAQEALAKSYAEIQELKDRLQAETDYLKIEIKVSQAHGQIIGRSQPIKRVLNEVEKVASADCTVLISGETGTGKELVAQEIHRLSPRRERVMVLVNCAALPSALVESELFGRERGAYTGALSSQVGRFELANGSTIFLDEVGELPTEVQAKLLRVLQQGEFQRLGSPKLHKVDVRVIAATNRDLAEEVRKGRFREDLYYRLKVFPIEIPPLRERNEDIPVFVFAFMEEFSTRMGKKITKVPRRAMESLQGHNWPGNVRELRNVIEHSVILSSGDLLRLSPLGDSPVRELQPVTLIEAEREHIVKALENTGWRIKGPHGAAGRLGLQPSTLYSRMQKLGIPHRRQKDEMATER